MMQVTGFRQVGGERIPLDWHMRKIIPQELIHITLIAWSLYGKGSDPDY